MNNLTISNKELTVDSREVAEMVEKQHSELLKDIRRYSEYLAEGNFHLGDFFQEGTYRDKNNQERPNYQITKKGCELIAHKLTGEKGTLFSAKYINKFHEMENKLTQPFAIPQTFSEALRLAAEQAEKIELLSLENKQKEQIIGELKPKADYLDSILQNKGLVTITQIAKDYGMTGQAMNDLLHDLKVQYKQSNQWLLYKEYQSCGYTHSQTINITRTDGRPDVKMNTKWTQKGRLFLYELLKNNGVLPVIERKVA